ncbi:MAG: hypothetical protein HPY85_06875 [Anaerolineae bacterium]|nr:hypothetical protein [Anaerolineae bacterium]
MAQMVNRMSGGAVISPWEVGELPQDWVDVFLGMTSELPTMREGFRKIESAREKWLRENGFKGRK